LKYAIFISEIHPKQKRNDDIESVHFPFFSRFVFIIMCRLYIQVHRLI